MTAAGSVAALGFLWLVYTGLTWDLRQGAGLAQAANRVVQVRRGALAERVVATGSMKPFATIVVQSEIPGLVAKVHVDDGERVERGQPLVELDRSRLEDQAAELHAALEFERARLQVDLVGRARLELAKTRRDYERSLGLQRDNVASAEQVESSEHRLKLAEISLSDAHAERAARIASEDRAQKALQRALRDLEKSVIRAPVDAIVIERRVEVGAAVADLQNGGTVVAVLADDRAIHLAGEVDENDIAAVRVGQSAEVRIDAFAGELFSGHVRRISAAGRVEGSVSSFEVEVELDPDPRVRVGMSADARIVVREYADTLLIPNGAIRRLPEGFRVERIAAPGDAEGVLRPIEEIYSDGFETAVDAGVAEGDLLLVRSGAGEP